MGNGGFRGIGVVEDGEWVGNFIRKNPQKNPPQTFRSVAVKFYYAVLYFFFRNDNAVAFIRTFIDYANFAGVRVGVNEEGVTEKIHL